VFRGSAVRKEKLVSQYKDPTLDGWVLKIMKLIKKNSLSPLFVITDYNVWGNG
jgi:hypothetical protein